MKLIFFVEREFRKIDLNEYSFLFLVIVSHSQFKSADNENVADISTNSDNGIYN